MNKPSSGNTSNEWAPKAVEPEPAKLKQELQSKQGELFKSDGRVCSIQECGKKHYAKGLCQKHYARLNRHGHTDKQSYSGNKNPRWKGGITTYSDGRVIIYSPDHPAKTKQGYVLRSRLTMERIIGRYLTQDEIVHHINEIKDDDRPENLQLMTASEHMSLHAKVRAPKKQRNQLGQFIKQK